MFGRRPDQCINFIVAHDGFTLHDLCAYNVKHNDANGEGNRDGSNDNFSWNCGAEGQDGADGGVLALRGRQMRNFMVALLMSQGTPMVLAGASQHWSWPHAHRLCRGITYGHDCPPSGRTYG